MNVFTTAVLLVVTAKILKTAFEDESGTLLHQTISSDFLYVEDNRGTTVEYCSIAAAEFQNRCSDIQLDISNIPLVNNRPIIGIIAQRLSRKLKQADFIPGSDSYIYASYVKLIEGGGGRVVPIMVNQNDEYYKKMFHSINGLILPGGTSNFNDSNYRRIGSLFFEMAIESNEKGDFFPILGICLGFQFLAFLLHGDKEIFSRCRSFNQALKLNFLPDAAVTSNLYKEASQSIVQALSSEPPTTAHFHQYCLTTDKFMASPNLRNFYTITTTATSADNVTSIASFEAKRYPFYGLQFHPEKNIYEWNQPSIPKTAQAIQVGQYFGEFFVNQARRSRHTFASPKEETDSLIFNYQPTFTGRPPWDPLRMPVQIYFFH